MMYRSLASWIDPRTADRDRSSRTAILLDLDVRRGHQRRSLRESLRGAIQDGRLTAGTRLPSSRVARRGARPVARRRHRHVRPARPGGLSRHPATLGADGRGRAPGRHVRPGATAAAWRYDFIATNAGHLALPAVAVAPRARDGAPRHARRSARLRRPPRPDRAARDARGLPRPGARRAGRPVADGHHPGVQPVARPAVPDPRRARGADDRGRDAVTAHAVGHHQGRGGLRLVGVPMDDHGPRLDVLDRLCARTPSSSLRPTSSRRGQVMAAERRMALVAWARAPRPPPHRGRLRRREPLRPAADRGAPGSRPEPRRPRRDGLEDPRPRAAAGLAEPAGASSSGRSSR